MIFGTNTYIYLCGCASLAFTFQSVLMPMVVGLESNTIVRMECKWQFVFGKVWQKEKDENTNNFSLNNTQISKD